MRRDSPLAALAEIRPEDLLDKPLLHSRQSKVRDGMQAWFGRDMEELNVVGTYNLLYNASLMVEEGVGYALPDAPLTQLSEYQPDIQFFTTDWDTLTVRPGTFYIVWPQDLHAPRVALGAPGPVTVIVAKVKLDP